MFTSSQANEEVAKNLQQIKAILYGDGGAFLRSQSLMPRSCACMDADPLPELVAQLAQETYSTDLLFHLLQNIHKLEFESRKDVVQIFNNLLRRQIGSRFPTVEYLNSKPEVLFAAFDGYANEEIALNTGMILREMLRHEPLAKSLLYSDQYVAGYSVLVHGFDET